MVWRHARREVVILAVIATAIQFASGRAARAQSQKQFRGSENFGLRGEVRLVVGTSKTLNPDPRPEPSLWFPGSGDTGWYEFDSHGSFLAQGRDYSKNSETPRNLYVYDDQGRIQEMGNWAADGETLIRQVYKYGPYGPVEVRWYAGKDFTGRTTVEYDEHGNFAGDKSYDSEGRLGHESIEKQDARTGTSETEGVDLGGQSQIHVTDRVDDKTGILEHNTLDEKGHVVNSLRVHEGKLVSWWLSPDFECPEGQRELGIFNWNESALRLQTYYTLRCPRTLEVTTLHHAGKEGNIENDYEERRLEDGTLLARVEYEYVRDAHDNWTKREVWVWDAKTNKMIAVEEDQRIISYFDARKTHSQGEEKLGTREGAQSVEKPN